MMHFIYRLKYSIGFVNSLYLRGAEALCPRSHRGEENYIYVDVIIIEAFEKLWSVATSHSFVTYLQSEITHSASVSCVSAAYD